MECETLRDCFTETASIFKEKRAVTFLRNGEAETEISYLELDRDSNRMAHFFMDLGVRKGDRVILYLEKSLAFVVAHLAVQKIGAVAVPLNPGFKREEMSYLVRDADPALILSGPQQAATIRRIAPNLKTLVLDDALPYQDQDFFRSAPDTPPRAEIRPEDTGIIIYTSGTTGRPKGAMLTQGNLVHDARNIVRIWEITASDVLCHALPLFHVHGLCFALHTSLLAGSHVVMLDRFLPDQVIRLLSGRGDDHGCTLFMAVPSMYGKMMDHAGEHPLPLDRMRLLTSGSAPLLARDFEKIKRVFGKEPVEREGMSETGMNFSNPVRGERKPGSIGLPLPGLEVRIVDPETREDVERGRRGEIWLRGPGITPGYWRKPEETGGAFENGWFRTGDLGYADNDGYYFLTDRIKHIIISGGENISPKEVEGVIDQVEGVIESAVVGIPDEKWGEKVVAAVVKAPEARVSAPEIRAFCRERLHDWKCPKEVHFLKELPRNRMGKVLKHELGELLLARRVSH